MYVDHVTCVNDITLPKKLEFFSQILAIWDSLADDINAHLGTLVVVLL